MWNAFNWSSHEHISKAINLGKSQPLELLALISQVSVSDYLTINFFTLSLQLFNEWTLCCYLFHRLKLKLSNDDTMVSSVRHKIRTKDENKVFIHLFIHHRRKIESERNNLWQHDLFIFVYHLSRYKMPFSSWPAPPIKKPVRMKTAFYNFLPFSIHSFLVF